jgi:hypothetical protein
MHLKLMLHFLKQSITWVNNHIKRDYTIFTFQSKLYYVPFITRFGQQENWGL